MKCELFVSYYNTNRTLVLSLVNCNKLDCLATVRAVVPQVLPFFPISRSSRSATGCAVDAYSCSVEKMVCVGFFLTYSCMVTNLWALFSVSFSLIINKTFALIILPLCLIFQLAFLGESKRETLKQDSFSSHRKSEIRR